MVVVIVVVVGSILHDWGFSWGLFYFHILCARGLLGGAGYLRSFLGEGCLIIIFSTLR